MGSKPHQEASQSAQKIEDNKWILKPRALNIVWGKDKRYWNVPDQGDGPAELVQVCWLEVTGTIDRNLEKGTYEIKFKLEMKDEAFGWNGCPVFMMAKIGKKGKYKWAKFNFTSSSNNNNNNQKTFEIPDGSGILTIDVTDAAGDDTKLYFGLYEVWTGRWKGGLVIHHAQVTKK